MSYLIHSGSLIMNGGIPGISEGDVQVTEAALPRQHSPWHKPMVKAQGSFDQSMSELSKLNAQGSDVCRAQHKEMFVSTRLSGGRSSRL